jgi:hypothetical protein
VDSSWYRAQEVLHTRLVAHMKFTGALIVDVLRTHPTIIIGGIVQENPFFVPPDGFLRESVNAAPAQTDRMQPVTEIDGPAVQALGEIKRLRGCINNLIGIPSLLLGEFPGI